MPLLLEDAPAALRGAVRWVPEEAQTAAPQGAVVSGAREGRALPWALLLGVLALLGGVVAALRRRTS